MFDTLTPPRHEGCPSALRLTQHASGELDGAEQARMTAHLAGCARCRDVLHDLDAPAYLASSEARALRAELARRSGGRTFRHARLAAALVAAAAVLLVFVAVPEQLPHDGRSKGAEEAITVHVLHAGQVRSARDGDEVAAGDALRFATTSARPCAFVLYGYDGRGRLDRYARIDALAPGRDVALPSAVTLDDAPGEERFSALFCDAPPDPDALARTIRAAAGRLTSYPGCRVRSLALRKAGPR